MGKKQLKRKKNINESRKMQNEYGDWINSAGIERCCLQNGAGMNSTLNQSEFVFTKKLFQLITKLANKLRDEVNGLIEMHKLASSRASANNAVKSLENRNDWENWVNSCVNNFFLSKNQLRAAGETNKPCSSIDANVQECYFHSREHSEKRIASFVFETFANFISMTLDLFKQRKATFT